MDNKIDIYKKVLEIGCYFYRQVLKSHQNFVPKKIGDFRYSFIIKFPPSGTSITPPHSLQEFDFIIVAPIGFCIIHEKFSISSNKIMTELTKKELHISTRNYYDKEKLMFVSESGKYKLMKISHNEAKTIVNFLERYSHCISGSSYSFIPKFLGIFSTRFSNKANKIDHFLLFSNNNPGDYKIHRKFELYFNESYYNHINESEKVDSRNINIGSGLSDFMYNYPDGFLMNIKQRKKLNSIVEHDIEILRILRIYNYSLRIYVHNFNISKREQEDEVNRHKRRSFRNNQSAELNGRTYNNVHNRRMSFNKKLSLNRRISLQSIHKNSKNSKNSLRDDLTKNPIMKNLIDMVKGTDTGQTSDSNSDSPMSLIHLKSRVGQVEKKSKQSQVLQKPQLFNSTKLQANFFKAKRCGALFVYDIKGEYLAIFCAFGHVIENIESRNNWKTLIKTTFPNTCTHRIMTSASYSDRFEIFLKQQVFRPVGEDMAFDPWPDEVHETDEGTGKDRRRSVMNALDKWADIKARLLNQTDDTHSTVTDQHDTLSDSLTTTSF